MRTTSAVIVAIAVMSGLAAQEPMKPVPKDSVRVFLPGCTRGYVFTAGRRTVHEPGSIDIPEGTHLRMNGPKKLMAEIKAHEGSTIELAGLMKKGQFAPGGVGIGRGGRILGGPPASAGGTSGSPLANQIFIDVEGWRPIEGNCPSR